MNRGWQKTRLVRSNVKILSYVHFDCNDIERHEFWPHDRMINKEYYLKIMRKRTEFWETRIMNFAP